jgi:hypothetical protein
MEALDDDTPLIDGLLAQLHDPHELKPNIKELGMRKVRRFRTHTSNPQKRKLIPSERPTAKPREPENVVEVVQTRAAPHQRSVSSFQPEIPVHSSRIVPYCDLSEKDDHPRWAMVAAGRPDSLTNKGANHKRDGKIDHLKELREHQSPTFEHATTEGHDQRALPILQIHVYELTDRTHLPQHEAGVENLLFKHEDSAMVGAGIGRDRPRRHHTRTAHDSDETAHNPTSSSPSAREIWEIAETPDPDVRLSAQGCARL